jgi:F0F1-type ATP synthase membrane subunit c/vacuolar-type H+-ATPase subunit K
MGPMLMTGLACLGGAIGIGLIASGTWPATEPTPGRATSGRGLAIILIAFCQGGAVLGVVAGLLAIFIAGAVTRPEYGLLAAGPALVGALIGIILIARHWRVGDRLFSVVAGLYVLGLAILGSVVTLLAWLIIDVPAHRLSDWPFLILGLVSAASTLAIGVTGASAVASLRGADEQTIKRIRAAQITRSAVFELGFIGATLAAIALIFLS